MQSSLLEVRNLSKTYYAQTVLKNINISLKSGEIHAIIGENGAGKSTLMRILSGIEQQDEGQIYLESKPIKMTTPYQAQELGINSIYEEINLIGSMSVLENIFLGRWPLFKQRFFSVIDWKKAKIQAEALLDILNFNIRPDQKVAQLSAGEKKMVEIVKALYLNSKVLIIDEATNVFNSDEIESFFNVLKRTKQMGVSIFFVSHKIDQVMQIADTITIIRDGRIIATEDKKNVDKKALMFKIAGEDFVNRFPKIKSRPGKQVLRLEHLKDNHALKDVSFFLRESEIVGLTGLTGSGRSAIAKSIFGMNTLTSGEIFINNKKVVIRSPEDAIKYKIGYICEDRNDGLVNNMRMSENISLSHFDGVTTNNVIDKALENRIAKDYAKLLGLKEDSLFKKAKYLSGGNKQKIILAKWLFTNAKIFIFDEPTKGLDIPSKVEIYNLMNELILKDKSILLISSNLDELMGMSDRILVLNEGRIVAELKDQDIKEKNIIYYASYY